MEKHPIKPEDRNKDIFVIICGGPTRTDWHKITKQTNATIIGTNIASEMIEDPDIYICADVDGIIKYKKNIDRLNKLNKTQMLIGENIRSTILPKTSKYLHFPKPIGQRRCRTVGIVAVMIALNKGAKKIIICGMDGYSENEIIYTTIDNQIRSRAKQGYLESTNENQFKNLELLTKEWPDVEIIFSKDFIVNQDLGRSTLS